MKFYGNFVCSRCCTISHKTFEAKTEEEACSYTITCPTCGREEVQTTIPTCLKAVCRNLNNKGYHINMIIPNTLGISFAPKINDIKDFILTENDLPHEFTLDTTEDKYDIIVNDRMRYNDFEGIDKDQYTDEAIMNLLSFVRNLPQVGVGREVDLDKPQEVNMFDDVDEGVE